MARFICFAFSSVLCISAFAGGGNNDQDFQRWRRHLRKAKIVALNEVAANLAAAVIQDDADTVRDLLSKSSDDDRKQMLGHFYKAEGHHALPLLSALGLAVICGSRNGVRAIFQVAHSNPNAAAAVFAKDAHGQTPMNMAVYLDDAELVFEFVLFIALHPQLATLVQEPNTIGDAPLDTAIRYHRTQILEKMKLPVIPAVTAIFLAASLFWR